MKLNRYNRRQEQLPSGTPGRKVGVSPGPARTRHGRAHWAVMGITLPLGAFFIATVLATILATILTGGSAGAVHAAPRSQEAEGITLRIVEADSGASSFQGDAGGQVTMTVSAANAEALAGIQLDLRFDRSVVRAESAVAGDLPAGALFVQNIRNDEGIVSFVVAAATPLGQTNLHIADITFDLTGGPGQSTGLEFSNVLASDSATNAIPVTVVDGSITIRLMKGTPPVVVLTPTAAEATLIPALEPTAVVAATIIPATTPTIAVEAPTLAPTPTPTPEQPSSGAGQGGGGCSLAKEGVNFGAGAPGLLLLGLILGGIYVAGRKRKADGR